MPEINRDLDTQDLPNRTIKKGVDSLTQVIAVQLAKCALFHQPNWSAFNCSRYQMTKFSVCPLQTMKTDLVVLQILQSLAMMLCCH